MVLINTGLFCGVQNYAEKAELSKCSWYPKRKLGVTTHFSEIIKLQFGKDRHPMLCILKLFTKIAITLVKIGFSHIFSEPRKNTFEFVGTVLNNMTAAAQ